MKFLNGKKTLPILLLHGGAGPQDPDAQYLNTAHDYLIKFAKEQFQKLKQQADSDRIVIESLKLMEACEMFNAGYNCSLQGDGKARLTASFMDGTTQTFSGVMGLEYALHPSEIAYYLQQKRSRVIGPPGAELLARKLNLPIQNPVSETRLQKWLANKNNESLDCDTVGCIICDEQNRLFAGTSTGGRGGEFPGRMSDSVTVAGNYASPHAAISATGTGEQIIDAALAVRLETRVRDGATLEQSAKLCWEEAKKLEHQYGWIAVDKNGYWNVSHTTAHMSFVGIAGEGEVFCSGLDR